MKFLSAKPQFVCYAPIDLKLADLYLRDGYNQGTNVPLTSAIEEVGETEIALSGMNSAVPNPETTVGVSVKFGSDTTEYTVTARTLGAGTNEVQSIEIDDDIDGGNFTLTYGSQTTGSILWSASAAVVEAALEALSTLGLGTVSVALSGTHKWIVTFGGSLASTDASMISGTNVDLTSGDATTVAVVKTATGDVGTDEIQTITADTALTENDYTLTFDGETTAAIPWDAAAADIELQLETLDSIKQGEATVATGTGTWPQIGSTLTVAFSGTLGKKVLTVMTAGGNEGAKLSVARSTPGVAAVFEVQTISINDTVTGGTFTLIQGANTSVPILYNATAAQVETAIKTGDISEEVTVSEGPGPATDWVVTWDAASTEATMTGTGTNLTGGVATAVSVTETTKGESGTETTQITVSPSLVVATGAGGGVTSVRDKKKAKNRSLLSPKF